MAITSLTAGITTVLAAPTPSTHPTANPSPSCPSAHDICTFIYDQTGQKWLAESSYYLLVKPLRILMLVVAAMLLRHFTHRMINRLVARSSDNGTQAGLLRPLRERMPASFQEATGLRSQRRRQRAESLGSVLRSAASTTIFTITVLLVLSELGVDLAPLIASAGVAGVAIGFGAQNLVRDFIAGLFMLLEDQYGVGDIVDLGEAGGTVEAVGLRITTVRDIRGVVWYIRNGEIVRVGNKSQGWAMVVVDVPVGFAGVEEATAVLRAAASALADDPAFADELIEASDVLGVEQITIEGAVVRTTVKTAPAAQWRIGRELRRRLTEALEAAGIASHFTASRIFVRPGSPGDQSGLGAGSGIGGSV